MSLRESRARNRNEDVEALFREFTDDAPDAAGIEATPAAKPKPSPHASPFLRAVDALSNVFEREIEAIGASDFDAFKRLQGEKLSAIRNVERLQKSKGAMAALLDREDVEIRLRRFNTAIERNMKSLEAVRNATQAVHRYALKALEEKQSDGVYARDGSLKGLDCLSVNGNQIKL